MKKLVGILFTVLMSSNVYAHVACESEMAGIQFVQSNQTELIDLAEQTSSTLSNEGRMLLAVTSLRTGVSIPELNRIESEVPYVIGQNVDHMLNGEERALIASAVVQLKSSVAEIMNRAAVTSERLPTKLRILVAISSIQNNTNVVSLSQSAEAVYDNR